MRLICSVALAVLLGMGVPVHAADAASSVPLDELTTPPQFSGMRLSPDGQWVAGIGGVNQIAVVLMKTSDLKFRILDIVGMNSSLWRGNRPNAVHWISNDMLVVDFANEVSLSIDLEGKVVAKLGEKFVRRVTERGASDDFVLEYRSLRDKTLDLVNARTGERSRFDIDLPGKALQWAFDASGTLRAVTMMDTAYWAEKTKVRNWYRAGARSPWVLLEEFSINDDYWVPIRALPGADSLAVYSRKGRDTYAIFRYDAAKREHMDVMAGHPNQDILSVSGLDQASFESVSTAGIKPRIFWFDARLANVQATVDAAVPGRINVLMDEAAGVFLVSSYGDVDPGRWFLLDMNKGKLSEFAEAIVDFDTQKLRPVETISYAVRDGLTVNAYLTRPRLATVSPAPMVVLIHGGPNVRDRWGYNQEVQILAAAGYVVFQPQFRGSSGFGRKFEEAGFQQWGKAMQDDITDGVKHLIAQGVADPRRICIDGASYGGYAALWGVIKTPELFKCGVSFAGVSDLAEMTAHSIFDDSTAVSREISRARIGDPEKMRQQLDEVSPLKHAGQVNVPLFIAHGERDARVLASQSKKMVAALKELGKPVESMWFEDAGHGFYWRKDEMRYYRALLAFLSKHIGENSPYAAEIPAASAAAASAVAASSPSPAASAGR